MGESAANNTCFRRINKVMDRVGLSRSQIYKLMGEGRFPRAIKLSTRAVAWDDGQITEWMNKRLAGHAQLTQ